MAHVSFPVVGGLRVRVVAEGEGPLFVLLPSPLLRAESYAPLRRALARRFTVLVLELPGSGRSERLSSPWRVEQLASFVRLFLSSLGAPAIVLGHSHSAPVAYHVAMDGARACAAVVLADPVGTGRAGLFEVTARRLLDALFELRVGPRLLLHVLRNVVAHPRSFFGHLRRSGGDWLLEGVADGSRADGSRADGSRADGSRADGSRAHGSRARVPVLVAHGRLDLTMPRGGGEELARRMHAEHVVVPGAHDGLIARPRAFTRIVTGFLERAGALDAARSSAPASRRAVAARAPRPLDRLEALSAR
jgi:pimeloyl-ACP methyl ester carboxylesterase